MNHFALLVGLGNPGLQYLKTRHNAGFWFVDQVANWYGVEFTWQERFGGWEAKFYRQGEVVYLLKPAQYMNRSGGPVAAACRYYRVLPERLLVAHDELDFEPGVVRLKKDGSHGGHNGVRNIIEHLRSSQFWRLRIGIGRPKQGSVVDYVLGRPTEEEQAKILAAIDRVVLYLPELLERGAERAMNFLHK